MEWGPISPAFGFFDRAAYEALQALGYDQIPTRALNYIWASRMEKGTVLQIPFTDWPKCS